MKDWGIEGLEDWEAGWDAERVCELALALGQMARARLVLTTLRK